MLQLKTIKVECRNDCGATVEQIEGGPRPYCQACQDAILPRLIGGKMPCAGRDEHGCQNEVTSKDGKPRYCAACQGRNGDRDLSDSEDSPTARVLRMRRQVTSTQQRLARAGAPARYQELTRASWEEKWKPWEDSRVNRWNHETQKADGERVTLAEISETIIKLENPADDWLLVLFGLHGRRKTGLATAILGEALDAGLKCMWIDAEDFVDSLEYGLSQPPVADPEWKPWVQVFRDAVRAEVLLIDDIATVRAGRTGRRDEQDWWKERLSILLRKREAEMRRTIVTGNMKSIKETSVINHSLPSRLSVRQAFKISGEDFRQMDKE